MTMIGFPPHPADRWSLATWQNAPAWPKLSGELCLPNMA